jgi:uroporphyrinogen decarboxylase
MLGRERVIEVIEHRRPDRVPVYGWVRANLDEPIRERFGSADAFEDHYEFDLAHLFGGPRPYRGDDLRELRDQHGGVIEPAHLLELDVIDPTDTSAYTEVVEAIEHHKHQRGRFVYMQTPGSFEFHNGPFGVENHLMYLALYERELMELYGRLAEWDVAFANCCLDLGVDMIHVSDDWGAQQTLMFSPAMWRRMIYPHHKHVADAVKARGAYVSLHSDGNISSVLDGVVDIGYDVVHPYQESAGMDLDDFAANWQDKFTVMGGLDVQTTIGFGKLDQLRAEIERVLTMFRDGGLIFCTTHFIQNHCTIDELVFAFDLIQQIVREQADST